MSLLPLRLRLDHEVAAYLAAFTAAVMTPHTAAALELLGALQVGWT